MEQGKAYKIQINSAPPSPDEGRDIGFLEGQVGVRVGYMSATEHDKDVLSEAVELAKAADYSIIFTGNDTAWETEGQDQASFHLPKNCSQDHLVAAIAATCSTTIVVNSTGVPVALPWLDQVDSLLQAWFPGQEAGNSIADVLTGAQNPEGHLTCTFPKRLEDCPAFGNFPGYYDSEQKLQVNYEEGLFVGYRHFDRLSSEMVNFPFGFGLSYTTFEFADLNVQQTTVEEFLIQATVSNTGNLKGSIAVQVYVGKKEHCPADPIKVLVGFRKVTLEAFASATVDITVKVRDFATWEGGITKWIIEEGDYIFTVGKSAAESEFTSVIKITSREFSP
jgi:beta-glucosidase